MSGATVFGITQSGRPCRVCLRMNGFCHHHVGQQQRQQQHGRAAAGYYRTQQPAPQQIHAPQPQPPPHRVFGYTQRGLPCKNCLRKGDFCHLHEYQRGGSRESEPAERSRSSEIPPSGIIQYGITVKGLPCKICIRKGGYCRYHGGQRPRASPVRETQRASPTQESRRARQESPRRTSRPARVHNEERQRQIYGITTEQTGDNYASNYADRTQPEARSSPRRRRTVPASRRSTEEQRSSDWTPNILNPVNNSRRGTTFPEQEARNSPRQRRRSPRNSHENHTTPDRRGGRRSEGQATTLNMSNQEMDDQFYRLLGLFADYMRLVQQDEEENIRNGRRSSQQARTGDGTAAWGVDQSIRDWELVQNAPSRISVDSLREFVNQGVAEARRASQQRPPNHNPFAAASHHAPPAVNLEVSAAADEVSSASTSTRSEAECIICLEKLNTDGQYLKSLPCGHEFHYVCLEQWKSYSSRCPLCRSSNTSLGH